MLNLSSSINLAVRFKEFIHVHTAAFINISQPYSCLQLYLYAKCVFFLSAIISVLIPNFVSFT